MLKLKSKALVLKFNWYQGMGFPGLLLKLKVSRLTAITQ